MIKTKTTKSTVEIYPLSEKWIITPQGNSIKKVRGFKRNIRDDSVFNYRVELIKLMRKLTLDKLK